MSGNLPQRRMVKFIPAEFKPRVICYAFSVPASAFVTQVNRATSQTLRTQASQEGLVPLKTWVKMVLDRVVQTVLREPDLEFVWVGDDAVDPLEQAQTIAILVNAGVKTRDEARVELGLAGAQGVAKYNNNHDERGQFTTAEGAVEPGTASRLKPDRGIQVAENEYSPTMTDAGAGSASPQMAIGAPIFEEPPPPEPAKPAESAPALPEATPNALPTGPQTWS